LEEKIPVIYLLLFVLGSGKEDDMRNEKQYKVAKISKSLYILYRIVIPSYSLGTVKK